MVLWSLLAWFLAVEVGVELWYRAHERHTAPSAEWTIAADEAIAGFTKIQMPTAITGQFRADQSLEGRWQDGGNSWQLYYFRWQPARALAKRLAIQLAKTHGPEKCLPRIGMTLKSSLGTVTVPSRGKSGERRAESGEQEQTSDLGPQTSDLNSQPSTEKSPLRLDRGEGQGEVLDSPLKPQPDLKFQQFLFTSEDKPIHVFYAIYEDPTGTTVLANRRRDWRARIAAALSGSRNYGQRFLELAVVGPPDPQAARAALESQLPYLIQVR